MTVTCIYDPLHRLKEANYSNNDYYHYTGVYPEQRRRDADGNRKPQPTSIARLKLK